VTVTVAVATWLAGNITMGPLPAVIEPVTCTASVVMLAWVVVAIWLLDSKMKEGVVSASVIVVLAGVVDLWLVGATVEVLIMMELVSAAWVVLARVVYRGGGITMYGWLAVTVLCTFPVAVGLELELERAAGAIGLVVFAMKPVSASVVLKCPVCRGGELTPYGWPDVTVLWTFAAVTV
jgi:hypothetical protein